jgi:hypothetical protein
MSSRFTSIKQAFVLCFICLLACLCGEASAESIEKAIMPGQVIKGHAKFELECKQCHQLLDKSAQARLCIDCHKEIAKDIKEKAGLHGHLEEGACRLCHTEHKGRTAKLAPLDTEHFDHDRTGFQLKNAHKDTRLKCASCHVAKAKFRAASKLCNDCHKKDDVHKGSLGKQCENCHSDINWKEAKFDHEKTKFGLAGGKHAELKCKECHTDKSFKNAPLTCNGCHKKIDQEKGHKGRYGSKCESCHTDQGWKEISFDHDKDTHYPLRGKHQQAKCNSCHLPEKGALYQQKLPSKCVACHKKDDQEKGHKGSLGEKCDSCHNERGWKTTSFDHDKTHFPLLGKHRDAKCETCHKGGVSGPNAKLKIEKECVACHKKDDQDKGHKGRYGNKCETCHNEKGWKTASKFDHDRDTRYVLKGKHQQAKCDACHLPEKGLIFQQKKLESDCVACHRKDDKHKGQLGNKCETCHNEKRWQDAPYDHAKSRFPLTGSHSKVECKKCHVTAAFRDTPSDCNGCHKKDDTHKGRFGTKCETCHYTGTWKSWDFDHDKTRFKLDGGHKKVECYACHKEPITGRATINRTCLSCHTQDDVHDGGFGGQCERCHIATNWRTVRR